MKMIKNTGVPKGNGYLFRDGGFEFSTVAAAAYSALRRQSYGASVTEAAAKAGP